MKRVAFYVEHLYYFPHFFPIQKVFEKNGFLCFYIFDKKEDLKRVKEQYNIDAKLGRDNIYKDNIDVIFFANSYKDVSKIKALKVFLEHGIGAKSNAFYSFIKDIDIYLVEGELKYNRLKELYPNYSSKLALVGYTKFDEIKNLNSQDREFLFNRYNLDRDKKTILYAPTFFPSSIEKIENNFPSIFKEYNILIKPHHFTYTLKKYKNQLKKLNIWSKYKNCTVVPVEDFNITPLLSIGDIMISDESSAMFEFASLNKPVVSNQFFKLRWSYYLFPWKLTKRIDSSKEDSRSMLYIAKNYKEMISLTKHALKYKDEKSELREKYAKTICGEIDGDASLRAFKVVSRHLNSQK